MEEKEKKDAVKELKKKLFLQRENGYKSRSVARS